MKLNEKCPTWINILSMIMLVIITILLVVIIYRI